MDQIRVVTLYGSPIFHHKLVVLKSGNILIDVLCEPWIKTLIKSRGQSREKTHSICNSCIQKYRITMILSSYNTTSNAIPNRNSWNGLFLMLDLLVQVPSTWSKCFFFVFSRLLWLWTALHISLPDKMQYILLDGMYLLYFYGVSLGVGGIVSLLVLVWCAGSTGSASRDTQNALILQLNLVAEV